jgi:hypothetical protein
MMLAAPVFVAGLYSQRRKPRPSLVSAVIQLVAMACCAAARLTLPAQTARCRSAADAGTGLRCAGAGVVAGNEVCRGGSKVLCRIRARDPYPQAGGISSDEEDGPMCHYAIVAELAGQHRQDLLREARAARLAREAIPLETERLVWRSRVITFPFRRQPAAAV